MAPAQQSLLHQLLDALADSAPSVTATVCRSHGAREALTYAEVRRRSEDLASRLLRRVPSASCSTCSSGATAAAEPGDRRAVLALHVPRTHPDFLPLLVAASRVGLPFVLLSSDLPDRQLEEARNVMVLQVMQPLLLVTLAPAAVAPALAAASAGATNGQQPTIVVPLDELSASMEPTCSEIASRGACGTLCFLFTGGTQRTKIVEVTHAMMAHERHAYSELWRPRSRPAVVLAHTSVYWGASALGQLSIALAYAGTVVWTAATEVEDLRRCIAEEDVSVLGVVPDHLDLLAPQAPSQELPSIEAVFTWGERLPRRIADRWCSHPRAVIRELLIATEYWLSLWADPRGDGVLRAVRGAEVLVLKDDGVSAELGELGELCLAGPMVTPGYFGSSTGGDLGVNSVFYTSASGSRFFRTRDLVRRVPGGLMYKGRADMMTKSKGKWVDMLAVEDEVSRLPGVETAKALPDPALEHYHLFLKLEAGALPGPVLDAARMALPPRVQLWQVPDLPRHPVTRKVDAGRLLRMVTTSVPSWPVSGDSRPSSAPPELSARLASKLWRHAAWTSVALGACWVLADGRRLAPQLAVAAAMWIGGASVLANDQEAAAAALACAWLAVSFVLGPPDLLAMAVGARSVAVLTYGWLTLTMADDARHRSAFAAGIMLVVDEIPLWKLGSFVLLSLAQHLPRPVGSLAFALLALGGAFGASVAARRGRLLAWPLVFWSLGGHQLERDCQAYARPAAWRAWAVAKCWRLWQALPGRRLESFSPEPPRTQSGWRENAWVDRAEWSAGDDAAAAEAVEAESAAASWLEGQMQLQSAAAAAAPSSAPAGGRAGDAGDDSVDPEAKRRRLKGEDGLPNGGVRRCGPASVPAGGAADWEQPATEEWLASAWWYRHIQDVFDIQEACTDTLAPTLAPGATEQDEEGLPLEVRALCAIIGEVDPLLKPVRAGTVLVGMDSLKIARLSLAIRSRLGKVLTVLQLREAKTVAELASVVTLAREVPAAASEVDGAGRPDDAGREYAVWFSPGQYTAMGQWVHRSDEPLDRAALVAATQRLVERHMAFRVRIADPLRYSSFCYDAATLFTLCAPVLDSTGVACLQFLRRLISWALTKAWPRVKCFTREEMYKDSYPSFVAPLELVQCVDGQDRLERELGWRRSTMAPPGKITGYEVTLHLQDVWAYHKWRGRFVILAAPAALKASSGATLAYVDVASGEWGPLLGPCSTRWQHPPYGFPAAYFVPLSSGAFVWLRLEKADELRVHYKEGTSPGCQSHHMCAFRAAPKRDRAARAPTVISVVTINMWHAFADGNCYLPLAQDLFAFYDAARGKQALPPATITNAMEELERRLFDTFHCRASPMRCSLRGSLWHHSGVGYGHILGLAPGAMSVITQRSSRFRVPVDVALLGLVTCAMARADASDVIDFTLYAPMRDGLADAMSVGLFADWRDLRVSVDFDFATVLGTILQLSHKVQHRQWTVFNALKKPECVVVNIQPLDFTERASFMNLGENMWRHGDQLSKEPTQREKTMKWAQQPAAFVIEQQDQDTWWVLASAGHDKRPTPWMRRFVYSFDEALHAFCFEPTAPVHAPVPSDGELLQRFELQPGGAR